jgi:hypothetical protein
MTNERDDGGPAFPAQHFDLTPSEHGLSIRDYFAAKAMVGIFQMVATGAHSVNPHDIEGGIAQQSYAMADAMLKARQS